MSSVTILTDDSEIVIIPRHRASLQLVGVPVAYREAGKQPGNPAAFPIHTKFFADGSTVTSGWLREPTQR